VVDGSGVNAEQFGNLLRIKRAASGRVTKQLAELVEGLGCGHWVELSMRLAVSSQVIDPPTAHAVISVSDSPTHDAASECFLKEVLTPPMRGSDGELLGAVLTSMRYMLQAFIFVMFFGLARF
jgi:hypothetical protein